MNVEWIHVMKRKIIILMVRNIKRILFTFVKRKTMFHPFILSPSTIKLELLVHLHPWPWSEINKTYILQRHFFLFYKQLYTEIWISLANKENIRSVHSTQWAGHLIKTYIFKYQPGVRGSVPPVESYPWLLEKTACGPMYITWQV